MEEITKAMVAITEAHNKAADLAKELRDVKEANANYRFYNPFMGLTHKAMPGGDGNRAYEALQAQQLHHELSRQIHQFYLVNEQRQLLNSTSKWNTKPMEIK